MAMKTLFVFGNGFDLAHGLPTKYEHYFYFIEALKIYVTGHSVQKLHSSPYIRDSVSPEMLDYLARTLSTDKHPEYIDTIISTLHLDSYEQRNPWHNFFYKRFRDCVPGVTWIDFEKAIQEAVQDLQSVGVNSLYLSKVSDIMGSSQKGFPVEVLNLQLKVPELSHSMPMDKLPHKEQEYAEKLVERTALFLYHELLRYAFCFELFLCYYALDADLLPDRNDCLNGILSKELGCRAPLAFDDDMSEFRNTFILSFNYTRTFEFLYEEEWKIHHIHGIVRDREELDLRMQEAAYQLHTPIVLGFHNPDKNSLHTASPFVWFEKFYQRIIHKTGTDLYKWIEGEPYDSLTAVFYGHSLDATDADLIRRIFDASNCVKIYYHEENAFPGLLSNLIRIFNKDIIEQAHSSGKLIFLPTT